VKQNARWRSERLGEEVSVVRWGAFGMPVLLFPTAGGDAEEIERFHVIGALRPLLDSGAIKVYSCDSVAGQWLVSGQGSVADRCRIQDRFHEFVRHEVVPAIRADCRTPDIEIVTAGSSIGAFHALATLCRYPDVFAQAICLSGTYDLTRFLHGEPTADFYRASPLHFLPGLEGRHLDAIRRRFVILASGEGRAESIGESWHAAHVLGSKGIPNRVDSWGAEWHHDWPTWRAMLPQYLGAAAAERAARDPSGDPAAAEPPTGDRLTS
jgi:esterase/lipase superfamily enzyme